MQPLPRGAETTGIVFLEAAWMATSLVFGNCGGERNHVREDPLWWTRPMGGKSARRTTMPDVVWPPPQKDGRIGSNTLPLTDGHRDSVVAVAAARVATRMNRAWGPRAANSVCWERGFRAAKTIRALDVAPAASSASLARPHAGDIRRLAARSQCVVVPGKEPGVHESVGRLQTGSQEERERQVAVIH